MEITWEAVKEEAAKLPRDGWPAVQQAIRVGEMLIALKAVTPHGEFMANYQRAGILERSHANNMMSLARHRALLEEREPHGEFEAKASRVTLFDDRYIQRIMSLARHRAMLEEREPESQRQALALIKPPCAALRLPEVLDGKNAEQTMFFQRFCIFFKQIVHVSY